MNILRAEHYLRGYPAKGDTRLSDVYDHDDTLAAAMCALFPDFEYPDFAHKTLAELWGRYTCQSRALAESSHSAQTVDTP